MNFKEKVIQAATSALEEKITITQKEMQAAQASANEETKSSAGNKYETGRAMSQNERDRHAQKLAQLLQMKKALISIKLEPYEKVQIGSLVQTESAIYFLATGLGIIHVENQKVAVISAASPVGQAIIDKKEGDKFSLMQKAELILRIE